MNKVTKNLIMELTAIVMVVASFWIKSGTAGAVVEIVASVMMVNAAMNFLIERPKDKKVIWIISIVIFLLNVVVQLIKLCLGWF